MPRKDYTDITILLDKSGSMQATKQDTIGGFNQFLEDQKKLPGEAILTLAQFDTEYELFYNGVWLSVVPPLNDDSFRPSGMTALLDAIGKTINGVGKRFELLTEESRPEKIIFVVITDGQENSSRKFTHRQIGDMIKHQQDVYKWQFVFIGANQDAIATASAMNIDRGSTISVAASPEGVEASYRSLSKSVGDYRSNRSLSVDFSDKDREIQDKLGAWKSKDSK